MAGNVVASPRTRAEVLSQLEGAGDNLGWLVWVEMYSTEVNQLVLKYDLEAAGFGKFVPKPVTDQDALDRAVNAWLRDNTAKAAVKDLARARVAGGFSSDGSARQKIVAAKVNPSGDTLAYVIDVRANDLGSLSTDYGTKMRIQFNKKTERIVATFTTSGEVSDWDDGAHEHPVLAGITQAIRSLYYHYKETFLSGDISGAVNKIVQSFDAITMRQTSGGLYFVPRPHAEGLQALMKIVTQLPPSDTGRACFVGTNGVSDNEVTRSQQGVLVVEALLDEIKDVATDLDSVLAERVNSKNPASVARVSNLVGKCAELSSKAAVFGQLLQFKQETLQETLDKMVTAARLLTNGFVGGYKDDDTSLTAAYFDGRKQSIAQAASAGDGNGLSLTWEDKLSAIDCLLFN